MNNRILIFGAGVIGSAYAIKFIEAGADVTVFARSGRYEALRKDGLLYYDKGAVKSKTIRVINKLEDDDRYDFVFVAVRYDKAEPALRAVKENTSPTIVTLISNSSGFSHWQNIVGNRLIPGFPGVGGQMREGVLNARYMPKVLASTNFGEVNGSVTNRIKKLAELFDETRLPYAINGDMNAYLITHAVSDIAMLGGLYSDSNATDKEIAKMMVSTFRSYLTAIQKAGITVTPSSQKVLLKIPDVVLRIFFAAWQKTKMVGEMKMPEYAAGARSEVIKLRSDLLEYLKQRGVSV